MLQSLAKCTSPTSPIYLGLKMRHLVYYASISNRSSKLLETIKLYTLKRYSSRFQPLDPNQASRRQKLTFATYLSGCIGVVLLSAVGYRYYGRIKRRASGMEELKVPDYCFGRRPWLFKYRGFNIIDDHANKMRDIHVFDVREDDVWVVTYPKAGTTWLQEIVYLVMNDLDFEKASKETLTDRFPYFEFRVPGLKSIDSMASPRLLKSHLPLSLLPNQMKTKKPKIIYLARNPKDTLVSLFNFSTKFLDIVPFTGTFESFCQLFAEDKVMYGPWWKHVSEAWARKEEDNIHFLFYEDMQEDLPKCIRKIATFLGKTLTDEQVSSIANHCSFENMKANDSVNYEWLKDVGVAKQGGEFYRKGQVGDWKNHLSPEIVKQLDEMIASKIPDDMPIRDSIGSNAEERTPS